MWWCLPEFEIPGYISLSSANPNPQNFFWRQEYRDAPHPQPLPLVFATWSDSSCLALMRLTPQQQSNKTKNTKSYTWVCFWIPKGQRRGAQTKGAGRKQSGILEAWIYAYMYICIWVLGKVNARNQLFNCPNNRMEMSLPHPPLSLQCQHNFSFVHEFKITTRWWNRTWK